MANQANSQLTKKEALDILRVFYPGATFNGKNFAIEKFAEILFAEAVKESGGSMSKMSGQVNPYMSNSNSANYRKYKNMNAVLNGMPKHVIRSVAARHSGNSRSRSGLKYYTGYVWSEIMKRFGNDNSWKKVYNDAPGVRG